MKNESDAIDHDRSVGRPSCRQVRSISDLARHQPAPVGRYMSDADPVAGAGPDYLSIRKEKRFYFVPFVWLLGEKREINANKKKMRS